MPTYPRQTDETHTIDLPAEIRCYWSQVETWNDSEVWCCVDTRGVKDGTPVKVALYRWETESSGCAEKIDEFEGQMTDNYFEHQYRISLSSEQVDAVVGDMVLIMEATVESYALSAESQQLLINKPPFSS